MLFFISLTYHDVSVMQSEGAVISQRIFNEGIGIFAVSLGQAFVLLSEIYAVALYPGRNPCLIIGTSRAVRQINFVIQLVILTLDTNHFEQVNIGRTCTYEAIDNRITCQQVIDEQGV